MKASRYNRIFRASDGVWLAFNGWSCALAELDPADKPFIEAILADPDGTVCDTPHKHELREALLEAHFLVEDMEDELVATRADMLRDRFRTDRLLLTIAPTLNCNFRCDYCYEDHLKVNMSRAVQDALVSWVKERAGHTALLHVIWYGGEPLMPGAYPVVERLSEAFIAVCREHGVEYNAELVTNGYFLDREKMERLKALGVTMVQVTVDGDVLRIRGIRRQIATDTGMLVPPVHVADNLQLGPRTYSILVKGVEVARGEGRGYLSIGRNAFEIMLTAHAEGLAPGSASLHFDESGALRAPARPSR